MVNKDKLPRKKIAPKRMMLRLLVSFEKRQLKLTFYLLASFLKQLYKLNLWNLKVDGLFIWSQRSLALLSLSLIAIRRLDIWDYYLLQVKNNQYHLRLGLARLNACSLCLAYCHSVLLILRQVLHFLEVEFLEKCFPWPQRMNTSSPCLGLMILLLWTIFLVAPR